MRLFPPFAKARQLLPPLWMITLLCSWWVTATVMADDEHPPVSLDMDPCVPADADEVRRLLALELRGDLVPSAAQTDGATRVMVGCDNELTSLRVDDPLTRKQLQRTLQLADSDQRARDRLLALSIVELVVASWTELMLEMPSGTARDRTAQPDSSQRDQALKTVRRYAPSLRPRPAQIGFGVSAALRIQPAGVGLLWQAAGHAVYMVRPDWELAVSFERSGASIDRSLGSTELSLWAAGLGVFFDPRWSTFSLRVGPIVTLGRATLNPRAEMVRVVAQEVNGSVLDAGIFVGGRLHLRRSALLVGLLTAANCMGLRGRVSDAADVRYQGVTVGAALGMEVWP